MREAAGFLLSTAKAVSLEKWEMIPWLGREVVPSVTWWKTIAFLRSGHARKDEERGGVTGTLSLFPHMFHKIQLTPRWAKVACV